MNPDIPKPFSQACENNQQPILDVLNTIFTKPMTVVEIGSGTGQHSVFFSQALSHVQWQPTDLAHNHEGIEAWRSSVNAPNLKPVLHLDVTMPIWPLPQVDAFFSANTSHILAWEEVGLCIAGIGRHLSPQGIFCLYGPFLYQGKFTSQSNAEFDRRLKSANPKQSIRPIESVVSLAAQAGLRLQADHEMPAFNRLLVFKKA